MDRDIYEEEFSTIQAIYPEAVVDKIQRTLAIRIPIEVSTNVTLLSKDSKDPIFINVDYLPSLDVKFKVDELYPIESSPKVEMSAIWLKEEKIKETLCELNSIWMDFKDSVIFTFIDHLKSKFEIELNDLKIPINEIETFEIIQKFDYDAKIELFNLKTISCGICFSDSKGLNCSEFSNCHHIFCNYCLKDFFRHKIERGEIDDVHCPAIECTKKADEFLKKIKLNAESYKITNWDKFDNIFFKLPLKVDILERVFKDEQDGDKLIKRYIEFNHLMKLQKYQIWFPQRVVTCPRESCNLKFIKRDIDEKLTICPNCEFAFCCRCKHSWHGVNPCMLEMSMVSKDGLSIWIANNDYLYNILSDNRDFIEFVKEEESERQREVNKLIFTYGRDLLNRLSREFIADVELKQLIQSDSSKIVECPSCKCYIEKFEGCNKVRCSQCETSFCFLCGDILLKDDPYIHFTEGPCGGLLFEGILVNE